MLAYSLSWIFIFVPQKQQRHVGFLSIINLCSNLRSNDDMLAFSIYYPSVCTSEETTTFWPSRYITVISLFLPKKQRRHFGLLFILISLFVPQKQRRYFGFISILIFLFVPQKQRRHFCLLSILIFLFVPQKQRRHAGFLSILIFLCVPQKPRADWFCLLQKFGFG